MGNSPSNQEYATGYKALSSDFSCRGFKYEVGQTYEIPMSKKIKLGKQGFHFCRIPTDCGKYYPINATTRYAKVEAWDTLHTVDNAVGRKIRIIEELTLHQFTHLTGIFTTTNRTIALKDGKLHRDDDFPAIEWENGTKEYYIKGERHRGNNQPAIVKVNGDYTHYINGICHNLNGPAVRETGLFGPIHQWFIDGVEYQRETRPDEYLGFDLVEINGIYYGKKPPCEYENVFI